MTRRLGGEPLIVNAVTRPVSNDVGRGPVGHRAVDHLVEGLTTSTVRSLFIQMAVGPVKGAVAAERRFSSRA